ncbi:MAG TPA: DUF4126 domain-containing protein [Candidatus Binatia bacterium]
MVVLLAFLMGVVAGLRTFMAPAAVSWAARRGAIDVQHARLAFMGFRFTPWIFTLLAATELVLDQLPTTPSRTVPPQFGARLVSGALCGATIGSSGGMAIVGALTGAVGAVAGTLGGARLRAAMAAAFRSDHTAALVEDSIAIGAALCIAWAWGVR